MATRIKSVQKAAIVAAVIERKDGLITEFQFRELERVIIADSARRERFIQKMRSPDYQWKKPEPRRR